MSEPHIVEAVDPEDAFGALSDGTRIEILRALWDADDHELGFSALREAVGMRDSGQFNYHLDKLTDRFIAKTGDGYRLRLAGIQTVGALLAGAYTMEGSVDPFGVDAACPSCGSSMTFRYEDEWVSIDCNECPVTSDFGVPPGVFEGYTVDEFPEVAERYGRTLIREVGNGFCPFCEGRVRPTVESASDAVPSSSEVPDHLENVPSVAYTCDRCEETLTVDLGFSLLEHPAVVSFYYDHGVDVREGSIWRFGALTNERSRILDDDPFRATVAYPADDERLTLTVDDELTVLDVERTGE
ncbi:MAG: hypothetical protein ACI91T_000865 [Natronomonas sp.]|jgi:hypothetical protein